jgi:CRP-like cAMP-binding protein
VPELDARGSVFKRADAKLDQLAGIPLLQDCGRSELRTVSEIASVVTYEPGSVLIDEGSLGSEVFVIMDGSVVVTRDGTTLATLEPGAVLGEAALLDWWSPPRHQDSTYASGRRTASVTASADAAVEVLVFEPRSFEELRAKVPGVARQLLSDVGRRFRKDEPETSPGNV